jgi:hypothetical protein
MLDSNQENLPGFLPISNFWAFPNPWTHTKRKEMVSSKSFALEIESGSTIEDVIKMLSISEDFQVSLILNSY